MEGRGAQLVSCKGAAMRENKANTGVERDSIEVVSSGLMYEPMAETHHTSLSHTGYIAAANVNATSPQLNIVNGGMQVHLCDRPLANNPLAFPSISIRGFLPSNPLSKEINQLGCGPLYGNCEMGARGGMSHFVLPSQSQSNKYDVQNSEAWQRRFVMFDNVGSKRRMIFPPIMMNKFSPLIPSSLLKPALLPSQRLGSYYFDTFPDEAASCKDTTDRPPFLASTPPLGASFAYYNPHLLPIYRRMNSLSSSASGNCDAPLLSIRKNVEATTEPNLERAPELSCYSHENTEDLEALLCSDEEDDVSSTGHSPSDLTRNNSPEDSHSKSEGYSVCASKKRKRGAEVYIDDDTCSTATSGNKMCKDTSCHGIGTFSGYGKEGGAFPKATTHFKDLGYGGEEDLKALDLFLSDEVSSSSSANNQKGGTKIPCTQQQQPDGQSRKEKIKNILRLLRGIIPGGESMDTAFVLDEAIEYVRTLQFEVQKLQARKFT